jgi:hypothetical protein
MAATASPISTKLGTSPWQRTKCLYGSKISPAQSGSVLFALTGFINDMCPDLLGADALGRLFAIPPEETAKTPGEK